MPLKRDTNDDAFQLNLTPMIDVVFLLVIFFMTATQFAEVNREVALELPEVGAAGTTAVAADDPRVVAVDVKGVVRLDGQVVTLEALRDQLAEVKEASFEGPKVLVRGDAHADFEHVVAAFEKCRAAGITDVGVEVEVAENPTIRR